MDQIELLHAELAGTRRTLIAIGDSLPPPKGYQKWEVGLQRLEKAYQAANLRVAHLSELDAWRQIAKIWESLQRLATHLNDEIVRRGTGITDGLDDRFRGLVAKAAAVISDLSLQLVARLEQEAASPASAAIQTLHTESREVAESAGSSLFVPAATADRVGVWAPGPWQRSTEQVAENPWFESSQPALPGSGRAASSGARLPPQAVRNGLAEPATPRRAAVPPPVSSPVPPRARPR